MTHPPVFGDQRRKGSDLRRSWDDTTARDLLRVTRRIAFEAVTTPIRRPTVEVCDRCGSLELATRPCLICAGRRAGGIPE